MRSSLFAAVALGPLCFVAALGSAHAASITATQATPVATATATNGAPDNVDVASGGTVQPTAATSPAVTLNSNNAVTNEGTIQFNNVNGSTAVLIQGGVTGSFTSSGNVSNIEDFDPPDNNKDGVVEAPLAQGSNRFGVRVTGTAPFVGNITNSGTIFAEGNDSAGVSIEAPMTGTIFNSGTIGVTGDRSFGLRTLVPITGAIQITGPISTSGQAATAVSIGNDVSGAVSVYSDISSNGYSTASRSIVDSTLKTIEATPSEVQQSGPALVVGGNVGGGVYIGAAPAGTYSGSVLDVDGDGIPDGSEGAGALSSFGSSPALLIGGANRNVTLGAFGAGNNAFGLIMRGSVSSSGLYDGVSATGIQIGGTGGAASLVGGFRLTGQVSAQAYEAAATGLLIGAGGSVPVFQNENIIAATIAHSSLVTPTTATATAIRVLAGGSLPSVINYGNIVSSVSGASASSTAIADLSGTLSNVNNQGIISTAVTPGVTGGTTSGSAIALDLRANTTGVTLTQSTNPSPIPLTGTLDANNVFTATTTTPSTPSITGDILLGNGPNTVNLLGGTVTGALSLGSGASSLTINNGAAYSGALTHSGPNLAVAVTNGSLTNTSSVPLQATSLTVGSGGSLSIAVDPANNRAGGFLVSGPATIANGAKIGINLISNLSTAQTFTLISSPSLSVGESASTALGQVPYITVANLSLNQAIGTLSVSLRQRTAAEAGLNPAESAALQAVLAALSGDSAVLNTVYGQTDRAGFVGVFDQLLPDYSGGVFRLASAAARAVSRAASDADGPWMQEVTVGARLKPGHNATPFNAIGLGVSGGMERSSSIGVVGVTAALFTGDIRIPKSPGDNRTSESQLEGGVTWHTDIGQLRLDGRAAGGFVSYNYRRELKVVNSAGTVSVDRTANGKSSGLSLAGRFGGSYRAQSGRWYLQPEAHIDYFHLNEGAYTETGGGNAFDMSVAKRTSSEASATVSVRAGGSFGRDFTWRPELEFGYREIVSGDPGKTTAQFAGGTPFTLDPAAIQRGGAFGRFGFATGNDVYDVSIAAGAEMRSGYTEGDLKFRLRLLF